MKIISFYSLMLNSTQDQNNLSCVAMHQSKLTTMHFLAACSCLLTFLRSYDDLPENMGPRMTQIFPEKGVLILNYNQFINEHNNKQVIRLEPSYFANLHISQQIRWVVIKNQQQYHMTSGTQIQLIKLPDEFYIQIYKQIRKMGNTCKSNFKSTTEYDMMQQDGAPYYRPRTFSSHLKRMNSLDTDDDGLKARNAHSIQVKGRERISSPN